jgi:hypothetical protein
VKVHYVSCFPENDGAEAPLRTQLLNWQARANVEITTTKAENAEALRLHLKEHNKEALDVLIIGAHGHASLSGFNVQSEPVRWHDLALLLRGSLPEGCTFIFYSCNGGYHGIRPMFSKHSGPDFAFGPYIRAWGDAMAHAVNEILTWKMTGVRDFSAACSLVDAVNQWASMTYTKPYDQSFLRVMWSEYPKIRYYPSRHGSDRFTKPLIKLRGWAKDQ